MATTIHFLPTKLLPQFTKLQQTHLTYPPKFKLSCKRNNISDAELAVDLATEVAKLNTHMVQTEQALNKSKQLLFTELCNYMGLKDEEVEKQWRKMNEDDKWVLVKGFVSRWGANFHPLSARSVKDMVDEYLVQDNHSSSPNSSASDLFHGLRRLMWFTPDSKEESSLT